MTIPTLLAATFLAGYLCGSVRTSPAEAQVGDMLKGLGMKDDEAIESRLVARRILAAQKTIEDRSLSDLDAVSAEKWLERNCPE